MNKLTLAIALFVCSVVAAAEPPIEPSDPIEPVERQIFVPHEQLHALLENQPQRVFLSREEFDELLAKAKKSPDEHAPRDVVLLAASYQAQLQDGRAVITGHVDLEVLNEGLFVVALPFAGAGLRSAQLGDQAAPLGAADDGSLQLFVEGRGTHRLTMEFTAPVASDAAEQRLTLQLPSPPATRMTLAAPGNIDLKRGASIISRVYDAQQDSTRFEILLPREKTELVMTLNNRLLSKQQSVVASSVLVAELARSYQRLHVSCSFNVLHGAVTQFRFALPEGFEVLKVETPLLSRWEVTEASGDRVLQIALREPTTETTLVQLVAMLPQPPPPQWQLARIVPLDVVGQLGIIGIVAESRLQLQAIDPAGLVAIDVQTLEETLPPSVLAEGAAAEALQPLAAFYAPHADHTLKATFERPPARLRASASLLLEASDAGLELQGAFGLLPIAERIFDCSFLAPAEWEVTQVHYEDQPLAFERYGADDGATRIHVRLPQSVPAGQSYTLRFRARRTPPDWLKTPKSEIDFPVFSIVGAEQSSGAIAVATFDDLKAQPVTVEGLLPLDQSQKPSHGLAGVATQLAYRFDRLPIAARFALERSQPHVKAQSFAFYRLAPDHFDAHYEILYEVTQAGARQLAFELPVDTPSEVELQVVEGATLKQDRSEVDEAVRRFTLTLGDATKGTIRVTVEFQRRVDWRKSPGFALPPIAASGVEYQSGTQAIEGHEELGVEIPEGHPRPVDVGELVDSRYQPGRRLLGVFGSVGLPPAILVDVESKDQYALPPVVVERAELVTVLAASGMCQTAARYRLRSKVQLLEVQLPADAKLWSASLGSANGERLPLLAQRQDERLLIPMSTDGADQVVDVQLVYEMPAASLTLWRNVNVAAPRLLLVDRAQTQQQEVPTADLVWHLHLPHGYRVTRSHGSVFPAPDDLPDTKGWTVMNALAAVGAGPGIGSAIRASHGAADGQVTRGYYLNDDADYHDFRPAEGGDAAAWADESFGEGAAANAEAVPELSTADPFGGEEDMAEMEEELPAETPPAETPPAEPADEPAADAPQPPVAATVPPRTTAEPAPPRTPQQERTTAKHWALEGLRSLVIDLDRSGDAVEFVSLGGDPQLSVTIAHRHRVDWLAWGVALGVVACGIGLARRSGGEKARFLALVVLVTLLFPLLTPWGAEVGDALDLTQIACMALAGAYVAQHCLLWVGRRIRRPQVALILTLIVACGASAAVAQQPADNAATPPVVVQVVPAPPPLSIPADAIVCPYDPAAGHDAPPVERVLVPYAKYVELHRRAHPGEPIPGVKPPVPYAWAGSQYRATLADTDELMITGSMALDVFTDETVAVPLAVSGGVLTVARLDDQPARLRAVEPTQQPTQAANQQADAAGPLLQVVVMGKGRHTLELTVRFPLTREGGWRIAQGQLPAQHAASLQLVVPTKGTQLRLAGVVDRDNYDTTRDGGQIVTTLLPATPLRISWRPPIAEATVQRGLTADSSAVFDVQDDGLRLAWRLALLFPGATRETVSIGLPEGYLVERVVGDNVRGWETVGDSGERLEVTLLKAARDRQILTIFLSRRGAVDRNDQNASFVVPVLHPADVSLHQGKLMIRRSPILELSTQRAEGAVRDEPDDVLTKLANEVSEADDSPLEARSYQTYRFGPQPPQIALTAVSVAAETRAEVKSILRVAELERLLECRAELQVRGRPIYSVRLMLPAELEIEEVLAPGVFRWSETDRPDEDRKLLTVFLHEGQTDSLSIVVSGRLGERGPSPQVALPRLEVLDVLTQTTDFVVQADPSLQLDLTDAKGIEKVLPQQTHRWLQQAQRPLVRLALSADSSQYEGSVRVTMRKPRVSVETITNVRITDRAFEETVVLDYTIEDAGVRDVSFLLPAWLASATIEGPPLREKIVEPAQIEGSEQDWVRVRLVFQEPLLGKLSVLATGDRLLTDADQTAPIPVVDGARVLRRYVALESAGRSEVVVVAKQGFEPLSRQQSAFKRLAEVLGGNLTHAFLADSAAAFPQLKLASKTREAATTATAKIGLAEASLVLDEQGNYRASQSYRVDNRTEQFLDVELPDGAALWTVSVADRPVKPAKSDAGAGVVRIPLVKTAAGDDDFLVVIKYGGTIDRLGWTSQVRFPLVKARNIPIERSQVRLRLPESHRWWRFTGSMRRVRDDSDLLADELAYRSQQLRKLTSLLEVGSEFEKARARSNLTQLADDVSSLQGLARAAQDNDKLQEELVFNERAWGVAEAQLERDQDGAQVADFGGNRLRLEEHARGQKGGRADNVVQQLKRNFDVTRGDAAGEALGDDKASKIELKKKWFEQNKLQNQVQKGLTKQPAKEDGQSSQSVPQQAPAAPQIVAGVYDSRTRHDDEATVADRLPSAAEGRGQVARSRESQVERYSRQLEANQAQQPAARLRGPAGGGASYSIAPGQSIALADQPPIAHPEGAVVQSDGRNGVLLGAQLDSGLQLGTGLVSVEVNLPQRGDEYLFTTALGDIEITAQAVSHSLLDRLGRLALVAALAALVVLAVRWFERRGVGMLLKRRVGFALFVLGMIGLPLGLSVLLCLLAILLGGGILASRLFRRTDPATAAAS